MCGALTIFLGALPKKMAISATQLAQNFSSFDHRPDDPDTHPSVFALEFGESTASVLDGAFPPIHIALDELSLICYFLSFLFASCKVNPCSRDCKHSRIESSSAQGVREVRGRLSIPNRGWNGYYHGDASIQRTFSTR